MSSSTEQITAAIAHYQTILAENSENAKAWQELAKLYEVQQEWEKALSCWQKLWQLGYKTGELLIQLGRVLQKLGKFEEAVKVYSKAVVINPQLFWAYTGLGDALRQQKKWHEAEKAYEKALQIEPKNPDVYFVLGIVQHQGGNVRSAITSYQQALNLGIKIPELVLTKLWDALIYEGRWDEAVDVAMELVKIQPQNWHFYHNLAFAQQNLGDLNSAVINYEKAITINGKVQFLYEKLRETISQQGEREKAIVRYKREIKQNNYLPSLYIMLGDALVELEDLKYLKWSILSYEKAINLGFIQPWLYMKQGDSLRKLGELNKAKICYQKASKLPKESKLEVELTEKLGDVFRDLGQGKKAIAYYRKSLELKPKLVIVQNKLNSLLLNCAMKLLAAGKIQQATNYFNQLEQTDLRETNYQLWPEQNGINWPKETWNIKDNFERLKPNGVDWPKITVVTPYLNQNDCIEATILSVLNQEYPNLEYIVVTDDETQEVIKGYQERIEVIIAAKNSDVNAINQGLNRGTGELMTWLNSDGILAPGTLFMAALTYLKQKCDVVTGIWLGYSNSQITRVQFSLVNKGFKPLVRSSRLRETLYEEKNITWIKKPKIEPNSNSNSLFDTWWKINHFISPQLIFTRKAWEKIGAKLDDSIEYLIDYYLWVKLGQTGASLGWINWPFVLFNCNSQKKKKESQKLLDLEIITKKWGYASQNIRDGKIYFTIDLSDAPGAGLTDQLMQFGIYYIIGNLLNWEYVHTEFVSQRSSTEVFNFLGFNQYWQNYIQQLDKQEIKVLNWSYSQQELKQNKINTTQELLDYTQEKIIKNNEEKNQSLLVKFQSMRQGNSRGLLSDLIQKEVAHFPDGLNLKKLFYQYKQELFCSSKEKEKILVHIRLGDVGVIQTPWHTYIELVQVTKPMEKKQLGQTLIPQDFLQFLEKLLSFFEPGRFEISVCSDGFQQTFRRILKSHKFEDEEQFNQLKKISKNYEVEIFGKFEKIENCEVIVGENDLNLFRLIETAFQARVIIIGTNQRMIPKLIGTYRELDNPPILIILHRGTLNLEYFQVGIGEIRNIFTVDLQTNYDVSELKEKIINNC